MLRPDRRPQLFPITVSLALMMLLGAAWASAQSTLTWDVDLTFENDDNITYGDGDVQEEVDDNIYRIVPSIDWEHALEEHVFSLDLGGTFREGVDTELSDRNLRASALADLNFSGGLGFEAYDHFVDSEFDQQIFSPEAGVTSTQANLFGTRFSYEPRNRLYFELGYELSNQDYGDIVGARDIDRGSARAEVPVGRSVAVYGDVRYVEQTSDDQPNRDYDRIRWVGGVLWAREGSRFSAWLEAGNEEIDFSFPTFEDFDTAVFRVGTDIEISDRSAFSLSAGRDGYENPVGSLAFEYQEPQDLEIRASLIRETRHLFVQSGLTGFAPIFESTVGSLQFAKYFLDRFRIGIRGSYIVFDSEERDDDTVSARIRFQYAIREWMRLGAHYEYATKDSSDPLFDFDVNRIGVFLVFTKTHG